MPARARFEVERYGGRTAVVDRTDWRHFSNGREPDDVVELRRLVGARAQLDGQIAVSVQQLRVAGASWSVVGEVLGVSRSAAQKRYGRDELLHG